MLKCVLTYARYTMLDHSLLGHLPFFCVSIRQWLELFTLLDDIVTEFPALIFIIDQSIKRLLG